MFPCLQDSREGHIGIRQQILGSGRISISILLITQLDLYSCIPSSIEAISMLDSPVDSDLSTRPQDFDFGQICI
jgi:hypothetical protein